MALIVIITSQLNGVFGSQESIKRARNAFQTPHDAVLRQSVRSKS